MNENTLFSIKRQPLVNAIIIKIKELITNKIWKVDQRIPTEAELTQLFNVGRNTMREAISVLSHSGMLEVRQGDGTYVRNSFDTAEIIKQISQAGLQDHFELRCMLEAEAAGYAAQRRTDEDMRLLEAALIGRGEYDPAMEFSDFLQRDMRFHGAVIQASHNEAMQALYHYFSISIKQHMEATTLIADFPEPNLAKHRAIFEGIANKNPLQAQVAVRNLVEPMIIHLKNILKT